MGGVLAALAGCGFRPVYLPDSATQKFQDQIFVQAPTKRVEYEFVKALQGQVGRAQSGQFKLSYDIEMTTRSTVVSAAQELERFSVEGLVSFTLTDSENTPITSGSTRSFTTYSATGSTLASDRSQRDAENRLAVILADQVVTHIIATVPR